MLYISPDDIAKYIPVFRTLPVWYQLVIVGVIVALGFALLGWWLAGKFYGERFERQKVIIDEYRERFKGLSPSEVSEQMARNQHDLTELKTELKAFKAGVAAPRVTGPPLQQIPKRPMISIQEPKHGQTVPRLKIVKGLVQPPNNSVQVFVRAGPKEHRAWYRQGNVKVNADEWTAKCVIGNDDSLTGGEYRLCAVAGAAPLPDRFEDFPSDVMVKSGLVLVILNRDLSDNWIPQVAGKENATTQSRQNSLIATLAKHHDRGKFLVTVPVKRNEDFESWELNVQGWRRDVIASLPKTDAVRFDSPVSEVDSSRLHPDALNRRHEQLKNRILADLAMIEAIMEHHRSE
jgi:hypothetical protein